MQKILLLFIVCATIFSCQPAVPEDDGQFLIVTTTGMLEDLAIDIVGEHAVVKSLMGPGVDPHLYKATQGDLQLLKQADLIIYNGLHLEGKMAEILEKMTTYPNKRIVAAGELINPEELLLLDEKNDIFDPHIWFDVSLWAKTIDGITEEIAEIDEDHLQEYRSNATLKKQTLNDLHEWVRNEIKSIPEKQRILITAHDAFSYFGRAYEIEVVGLQGISTLSEAGIKDVTNLVQLISDRNIKAVFVESSVPRKSIEAVVEGVKQNGKEVQIGGTLFSDAMGAADSPEGNYEGMVRYNVTLIVNSLQ